MTDNPARYASDREKNITDTVNDIIDHYRNLNPGWLKSRYIGWGEPFCFACGWLAPVDDGQPDNRSWHDAVSAGWLSIAQDRDAIPHQNIKGIDKDHPWIILCPVCDHEIAGPRDTADRDGLTDLYLTGSLYGCANAHPDCATDWQRLTDRIWPTDSTKHPTGMHDRVLKLRMDYVTHVVRAFEQALGGNLKVLDNGPSEKQRTLIQR